MITDIANGNEEAIYQPLILKNNKSGQLRLPEKAPQTNQPQEALSISPIS